MLHYDAMIMFAAHVVSSTGLQNKKQTGFLLICKTGERFTTRTSQINAKGQRSYALLLVISLTVHSSKPPASSSSESSSCCSCSAPLTPGRDYAGIMVGKIYAHYKKKTWSFCHYSCQVMEMNVKKKCVNIYFESQPYSRPFLKIELLHISHRFQQGCIFIFTASTQLMVSVQILKYKPFKVRGKKALISWKFFSLLALVPLNNFD